MGPYNSGRQDHLIPVLEVLPENLRQIILSCPKGLLDTLEEIHVRLDRPLMIYSHGKDYFLSHRGVVLSPRDAYCPTGADTSKMLGLISSYSIYAFEEELRNGYITIQGGVRVGITGRVVLDRQGIVTMHSISSFNIRIARDIYGVATKVLPYIVKGNRVLHTLIISPPKMGKTTLLRDIARQLSNGFIGFSGVKVGIVDERSEIGGCLMGVPQNEIGVRTDILDGCPKSIGITMLLRSMSPDVIMTDEIGKREDIVSIEDALNAGVTIITTAHSNGIDDAMERAILREIMDRRLFQRILVLGNSLGTGTLEGVYEGSGGKPLLSRALR